jgi:dTDP-4-amino-4,6-dideoxygalactose transaminase
MAGTFGDISAFSFYPTKNLAALGDAGCIACDSKDLAEECTLWANHGQSIRNQHHQLGRNSRMDELQAAVLLAQLPFLNIDNEKRRELADVYFQELDGLDLVLPMNYEGNVYHQFVIRTNRRDELKKYLREKGIETDIHYPMALSDMTVFDSQVRCRNASLASKTVLSLPIHPNHSEVEVKFVANTIHGFFTN